MTALMKPLLKLIRSIWLVALIVALGLPVLAPAALLSPVLFAYDGPCQARITYDGAAPSASNYDPVAVSTGGGQESQAARTGDIFGKSVEFPAAKTGEHIALGTREGLRDFAQQVGGTHLLDNPAWKEAFQKALADPSTKFSFKLDRLAGATPKEQVLNSIKASQEGWGGFTDWELHQLQKSGRLGEVNFFQGGKAVANPF